MDKWDELREALRQKATHLQATPHEGLNITYCPRQSHRQRCLEDAEILLDVVILMDVLEANDGPSSTDS